jgi:hypothetical protein
MKNSKGRESKDGNIFVVGKGLRTNRVPPAPCQCMDSPLFLSAHGMIFVEVLGYILLFSGSVCSFLSFFLFVVLGLELRAFMLNHSTSPFL